MLMLDSIKTSSLLLNATKSVIRAFGWSILQSLLTTCRGCAVCSRLCA